MKSTSTKCSQSFGRRAATKKRSVRTVKEAASRSLRYPSPMKIKILTKTKERHSPRPYLM